MRYEVRTENPGTPEVQYVVWDNLEDRVFIRYSTPGPANDLVERWKAAQMLAEARA